MKKLITFLGLSAFGLFLSPHFAQAAFECADEVHPKYQLATNWAIEEGILKGNPDGTCELNKQINRIAFAVMAMRGTIGDDDAQRHTCSPGVFNDVQKNECGSWYGRYAATAKDRGILKGDGSGNLRANDGVNAAEAAVIAARAYELEPYAAEPNESWYGPTFRLFDDHYVTTYSASHSMTRGEVILMMFEIYQNYHILTDSGVDEDYDPDPETYMDTNENLTPVASNSQIAGLGLNYRVLVEYFEYLTPAEVAYIFKGLNDTQLLQLGIYSPFGSLVHLTACGGDQNLIFNDGTGIPKDCVYAAQDWQYTPQPYFTGYTVDKRNSLLISIKCATGEIDSGSCGAYAGATNAYNNMMHDTSMRIIENIGNQCRINIDPGCYY